MSLARSSNRTVAIAVVPSSETIRAVWAYGDSAAATPSWSRTVASAASTSRSTVGWSTPSSECTTTCMPSPDISGNSAARVSKAA